MAFSRKPAKSAKFNPDDISFKNPELLKRFLTPEGKLLPGRRTGLTAKLQRKLTREVKRARAVGYLYFRNQDA